MMTRWMTLALALVSVSALVAAPPEMPPEKGATPAKNVKRQREMRKAPRMEAPVYDKETPPEEFAPGRKGFSQEERAKQQATMKRRFEIMVLIHAYKIMPEAQREPLKAELVRRIQEDFEAAMTSRKARIEAAEKDLKRMREEIAEQEANKAQLIEKEIQRLLKAQPPQPHDGAKNAPPPQELPPPEAGER